MERETIDVQGVLQSHAYVLRGVYLWVKRVSEVRDPVERHISLLALVEDVGEIARQAQLDCEAFA